MHDTIFQKVDTHSQDVFYVVKYTYTYVKKKKKNETQDSTIAGEVMKCGISPLGIIRQLLENTYLFFKKIMNYKPYLH